ncbi:MAG: hypothetical protein JW757_13985 [Anaerolineales bacterium]|nr:hypothetical protein [Anaerolineales bacterium]
MKKYLVISIVVMLVAALSIGTVMAEEEPPTAPRKTQTRDSAGNRVMADYMNQAIADLLGITLEEYDACKLAGNTLFDIAMDLGIDAESLANLRSEAREMAYEAALADGVIGEYEYQYFRSRIGHGQGGWRQGGHGNGNGGGRGGGGQFGDGLCDGTGECDSWDSILPSN